MDTGSRSGLRNANAQIASSVEIKLTHYRIATCILARVIRGVEFPSQPRSNFLVRTRVGTWLSLVEHSLGVRGVGSSNLPVPTNSKNFDSLRISPSVSE